MDPARPPSLIAVHRAVAKTVSGVRMVLTEPPSWQKCRGWSMCVPAWLEDVIRI
ncbi:MAG TPA: hypothetical protein PLA39_09920 [Methanoculleus sp.]|nr:hypothetical protein [Methanoculleus sp.]